jgi:hypothetical protein
MVDRMQIAASALHAGEIVVWVGQSFSMLRSRVYLLG